MDSTMSPRLPPSLSRLDPAAARLPTAPRHVLRTAEERRLSTLPILLQSSPSSSFSLVFSSVTFDISLSCSSNLDWSFSESAFFKLEPAVS